jgi:hypothetical protein
VQAFRLGSNGSQLTIAELADLSKETLLNRERDRYACIRLFIWSKPRVGKRDGRSQAQNAAS